MGHWRKHQRAQPERSKPFDRSSDIGGTRSARMLVGTGRSGVSVERAMRRGCGVRTLGSTLLVVGVFTSCGSADGVDEPVGANGSDVLSNVEPADWSLRFEPTPSAMGLHLLIRERACASGRSPEGRISVDVDETDERIGLSVGVSRLPGDQECPGNPAFPFVVTLSSPLGARLVDPSGEGIADDDQVDDDVVPTVGEPSEVVVAASQTDVGMGTWVEPRCEADPADPASEEFLPLWETEGEFASEDLVIGAAVKHYGLDAEGWHVLRMASPSRSSSSWWTQYLDGVAVAQVRISPGMIGWIGHASVCAAIPPDFLPDAQPGDPEVSEPPGRAPRLDVESWLASVPGLHPSDDGWRFETPDARCETWAAIEDVALAHDATVTFTSRFGAWPHRLDVNGGSARAEVAIGIADGSRGVMLTTDGDRLLMSDLDQDLVWNGVSSLAPCQLDQELTYTVTGS